MSLEIAVFNSLTNPTVRLVIQYVIHMLVAAFMSLKSV